MTKRTHVRVRLTLAERRTLDAWSEDAFVPQGLARRARLILLVAAGQPITDLAKAVGISRRIVYKWVTRFQGHGPAGLLDTRKGGNHRRRPAQEGGG